MTFERVGMEASSGLGAGRNRESGLNTFCQYPDGGVDGHR